jgi:hypothetical protein
VERTILIVPNQRDACLRQVERYSRFGARAAVD